TPSPFPTYHEEIDLGTRVSRPEEALIRMGSQMLDDLLQQEPFPRGSDLWMTFEIRLRAKSQESVHQTAVGQIDFRGFHLPLREILMPRGQLANHQRIGQQVDIISDCGVGYPESSSELGTVPDVAMVMRKHR